MADYVFEGTDSEDWSDPGNWDEVGVGPGVPGPGDSASLEGFTVTTSGETVGNVGDGTLTGTGLTVTGTLGFNGLAILDGGVYSAATAFVQLDKGKLSGGTIEANVFGGSITNSDVFQGDVHAGSVRTKAVTNNVSVYGGNLNAGHIDPINYAEISGGTVDTHSAGGIIRISGGSFTDSGALDGSNFVVNAGTATIDGAMTVNDGTSEVTGGTLQLNDTLSVAEDAGSTGNLTVSGAGAQLTAGGDVVLGKAGTATVNVNSGGMLDASASTVTLGEDAKGSATLTMADSGTQFLIDTLTVASAGKNVTVTMSGGELDVTNDVTVGEMQGAKGTISLTASGAVFDVGGTLTLGAGGTGTLAIAGGAATISGGDLTLGEADGAKGTLRVSGGTLNFAGDMVVGGAGNGSVTVGTGGTVAPGTPTIPNSASNTITLGEQTGSKGTLSVSGAGSTVTSAGLVLGSGGTGALKVSDSAVVDTTGNAMVAEQVLGTIQKASLSDSAEWIVGGNLSVGAAGIAQVTVASGSAIQAGNVTLGEVQGASGSLTVSGTATVASTTVPSSVTWSDALTVGNDGDGTLDISGGASAAPLKGGQGTLVIAAGSSGMGAVTVSGAGSQLDASALAVGGTANAAGGTGSVNVGSGATANFTAATIWANGTIAAGGTVDLGNTVNGGTLNVSGGSLTVTGTMTGTGIVAITKNGSFTLDASATKTANNVHITSAVGTFDLHGGSGNDTFKLAIADLTSQDTIVGGAGNDTLVFTTAGTIAAAAFAHVTGLGTLRLAAGTNDVTLNNAMVAAGHDLAVYLSTGTGTLDAGGIAATDTLTFHVAGGNDSITGGAGDNIYDFADGTLAIDNAFTGGAAAHGKLEFGTGLSDESLWFAKSGNNLVIDVLGTSQTVTVEDWYGTDKSARLDAVGADGLHLGGTIANLVRAMAAYEASHPDFDPAASGTIMPSDAALQHAITTDWVT